MCTRPCPAAEYASQCRECGSCRPRPGRIFSAGLSMPISTISSLSHSSVLSGLHAQTLFQVPRLDHRKNEDTLFDFAFVVDFDAQTHVAAFRSSPTMRATSLAVAERTGGGTSRGRLSGRNREKAMSSSATASHQRWRR